MGAGEVGEAREQEKNNKQCSMPHAQYNSWRGCALSVAMPQALRQLLETLLRSLSTSAQCPMPNA
ncbi:MAG: hypothetical protein V7K54_15490 [Nostoc sp.]